MNFKCKLLFLCLLLFAPLAQTQGQYSLFTISGRIVDENNQPFSHVNIFLTQSKTGTITNSNGAFSLTFSGTEDVLNASFIGYETQSVKVNQNTGFLKIQLKPSPIQLNEVVVSNLSAVALLKKAIEKIPENYPLEPYLSKAYYRAKLSEKDTLRYLEETAFNIVKSYRPSFSDEYFLVKNRNFKFASDHNALRQIGNFDMVKRAKSTFDRKFFMRNNLKFLPSTTFDNRAVYIISIIPREVSDKRESKSSYFTSDTAYPCLFR